MTTALRPNTGSSGGTDVLIPSSRQCHADQRPQQPTAQSSIPPEPRFPSGEWSRAIFTRSLDGILLLSEAGLIFAANPAACWMLQRPEEEMCGLSLNAVVETSRVDSAEVARAWPGHFRGELTMLRADGNPFPANVSATRFTDDSGQERTVVFFHDVSDRHQVEKAFQESQALFRSFMTHSPAAAYIKDDKGRYVYTNPLAAQILRRHSHEIIGKTDADLWPANTARILQGHDTTVLDMDQSIQVEESTEMADDIHHWLTLKFPIAGPARRLLGGVSVDITDHIAAETALRETHAKRIRDSLSFARTLSSTLSIETRLQEICQTTVELLDCDRSSIFLRDGEYYRARYNYGNPADIAATFSTFAIHHRHPLMAHAVEIPGRVVIEHDALHSALLDAEVAKQLRILAVMLVALWDDTGAPVGFLTAEYNEYPGTFAKMAAPLLLGLARVAEMAIMTERHVTARQQAEEALRHANSELEARVAERTRDLAQANADLRIEIAARQRAEDTLRSSEERYRIIGQSLSDCAFSFKITKEGHNIVDWVTDNFTKIMGIQPEETFGSPNPLKNTMHPEDWTRNIRILTAPEPDAPTTFEFRLMHPERGLRWIRAYIQRVGIEPDRAIRCHGAAQDITDRKQEQEEIERLNRIMSQRVNELSDLTRELEAFSYSVSHDLRAPLRHLHGFVELLHKHTAATLDDEGRRYIEVITKSANRMGQLIDDLLAFSRTTRTELHPTRVNLTHIVNEVVLDFATETETRKIVWDISPLPDVYGDTAMLRVVLTNLLGNAVKYTRPRGAARITIGTTTTAEHDHVCFVRDNGVGFDMRYVEKLFGVFQRLHRADEFEGTGIGLATVRRIVHRLGGRIWAEGELDKGATFHFSLPLAQKGTEG